MENHISDTTDTTDTAEVIAPPPTIPLAFLLAGGVLQRLLPAPLLPERVRYPVGIALIVAGFAGVGWFARTLEAADTPMAPYEPTRRIVTSGPYRFTRNPAYLSFNLIYAGIACLINSRWPLLLWPAMLKTLEAGVVEREERYLTATFGDEYRAYQGRVRRWL